MKSKVKKVAQRKKSKKVLKGKKLKEGQSKMLSHQRRKMNLKRVRVARRERDKEKCSKRSR